MRGIIPRCCCVVASCILTLLSGVEWPVCVAVSIVVRIG